MLTETEKYPQEAGDSRPAQAVNAGVGAPAKTCTRCQQKKPLTEFNKNHSKKDGRDSHCADCVSERKARVYRLKKKIERETRERRKATQVIDLAHWQISDVFEPYPDSREAVIYSQFIEAVLWQREQA